jgi:hypothetical protein
MVRNDERGVIGLEFGKKIYKLFFIRAESSHEPSRPQLKLGSFNYRARLARVILARARLARARSEPELSHEPEIFCAALCESAYGLVTLVSQCVCLCICITD